MPNKNGAGAETANQGFAQFFVVEHSATPSVSDSLWGVYGCFPGPLLAASHQTSTMDLCKI